MQATEHMMRTWDGSELFYRAWLPQGKPAKALLLFHRGHEHSGRWLETVDALGRDDTAIFAWDQRGHGRSPGPRGYARDLLTIIRDADAFARHVSTTYGISLADTAVIAHSVGAVIATAWVHDYAPPIRALVLAAPAFVVRLYVPLAISALRLKRRLFGGDGGFVKSYVKPRMLTHDPAQRQAYRDDLLIFRQIAVNLLLDLHDTSRRLVADAGAITAPTLILAAGRDWVVDRAAQIKFYKRISSQVRQFEMIDGAFHALFHETARRDVVKRIGMFLDECFARPASGRSDLLESDCGGYTRLEYDLLRTPPAARWRLQRRLLRTGASFSHGLDVGWKSGFDSGAMLDYVYNNRPTGKTPIGRCIDKIYLNSVGWRGIRFRRANLQNTLERCMKQIHASQQPVRILDIASGPGRYVLETMKSLPEISATARLRDYRQSNLDSARTLQAELGVEGVVLELADAFDRASLAAVHPRPNIAIVSGLYELFPENAPILRSLGGIADAIEDGGLFIYTNQPWHPQLEFIARVLPNRDGQPWIMRRRTQAEMDALVDSAGFEKIGQEIDPWGIFTVSLARRMARQ